MSTAQRIQEDLKSAMRSGDTLRRDTIRLLIADLKYKRIELGREPDEAETLAVLRSAVKRRQDSVLQYEQGGRPELAERERGEIGVIETYLPQKMSEDSLRAAVQSAIAETGATSRKDVGLVMKALMARHKDEVDGKAANRILGELLP
jgi:uncharacterized protein YqeY